MSEARKGIIFTEEHKRNLSISKKNMSIETKIKISNAFKGKKLTTEHIENCRFGQWVLPFVVAY